MFDRSLPVTICSHFRSGVRCGQNLCCVLSTAHWSVATGSVNALKKHVKLAIPYEQCISVSCIRFINLQRNPSETEDNDDDVYFVGSDSESEGKIESEMEAVIEPSGKKRRIF